MTAQLNTVEEIEAWIKKNKVIMYGIGFDARISRAIIKNKIYSPCITVYSPKNKTHKFTFTNLLDASKFLTNCIIAIKKVGFEFSLSNRAEFDYTEYRSRKSRLKR